MKFMLIQMTDLNYDLSVSELFLHILQMLELRQQLMSTSAARDQLLAEKQIWDAPSASSSMMSSSEGGDLQEILQGVREVKKPLSERNKTTSLHCTEYISLQLIQVQGELKQKKHLVSDQSSPTDKQNPAQIQQVCETHSHLSELQIRLYLTAFFYASSDSSPQRGDGVLEKREGGPQERPSGGC